MFNETFGRNNLTLQNRSCTRWCADAKATKACRKSSSLIMNDLCNLADDKYQTASTRNEARILHKKLLKFEISLNVVVCNTVLQKMDQSSKILKCSVGKLEMVSPIFDSLTEFI